MNYNDRNNIETCYDENDLAMYDAMLYLDTHPNDPKRSGVKLVRKVPKTMAGKNTLFSSLESTPAALPSRTRMRAKR